MSLDSLPNEILLHIFKHLTPSDRLACRLVSKRFYVVLSPFHRKIRAIINSLRALPIFEQSFNPITNIVLKDVELKSEDLEPWKVIGPQVITLKIHNCSMFEKIFVELLSHCHNLEELTICNTDSSLVSGRLLHDPEDVALLKKSLSHLHSLSLISSMYLSDEVFFRIISTVPNLRHLSLSGCTICFVKMIYQRFYPQTAKTRKNSNCILSLPIISNAIARMSHTLKSLDLSDTSLQGQALDHILQIKDLKLQELNLAKCLFLESHSFAKIPLFQPELKTLHLWAKKTLEFLPGIFSYCTRLDLRGNTHLTDEDFSLISNFTNLRSLNLSECARVTGHQLKLGLCQRTLPHLEEFIMSHHDALTDDSVCEIVQYQPQLSILNLTRCGRLTDRCVYSINKYCQNLKVLKLNQCKNISLDSSSFLLSKLKKLELLELGWNNIQSLYSVGEFPHLKYLDLSDCRALGDSCLFRICEENTSLEVLILNLCLKITEDALPYSLKNLPRLKVLDIQSCRLSDKTLRAIGIFCPQLALLHINNCPFMTPSAIDALEQSSPVFLQIKA